MRAEASKARRLAEEDLVPERWSPLFVQRALRMQLPETLRSAEDYVRCAVLNPFAKELDPRDMARLERIVASCNADIRRARSAIGAPLHEWIREKATRWGEGCVPGSPEAKALSEWSRGQDCWIGTAASADGIEVVLRIDPGEYAPLDVAYDDALTVCAASYARIEAFFEGL